MRIVWTLVLSLLCIGIAPPASAQIACRDSVYALVSDGTMQVFHEGATYNCCPTFAYEVELSGDQIQIYETEVESLCDCICCMDLDVTVESVPPGEYTVEFHWFDYETQGSRVWELVVSVGDAGQGGDPVVARFGKSDCYDPAAGVAEDAADTWTMIKALYR
jgi:hypothetical protein